MTHGRNQRPHEEMQATTDSNEVQTLTRKLCKEVNL